MRFAFLPKIIICVLVGCVSGTLVALTHVTSLALPISILLGALYGLLFALLLRPSHAVDAGTGLLWGLSYALLLWFAIPAGLMPLLQGAAQMGTLDGRTRQFPPHSSRICFSLVRRWA